jgi:ribosomal protein S18 acetylase RimI-like enzyme
MLMPVTSRAYQHPDDFERLARFLSSIRTDVQYTHVLHPGDLSWQVFHMLSDYQPADLIHIWEDMQGDILGFVLLFPAYGGFAVQLLPQHRGTALEAETLQWAEDHLPPIPRRSTLVNNHDTARLAWLTHRGYRSNGEWLYLERALHTALPPARIPPGFVVRSVLNGEEALARAMVLAAAFEAPPDPERYQHFMQSPGYSADLDIVAIAPNHQFAAFAMCWVDQNNQVGQFEPVGTAPAFRRQGIGQAVLVEGLRRMQQHGAERAIVIVEAAEAAAGALYQSVGFEERWALSWYTKDTNVQ